MKNLIWIASILLAACSAKPTANADKALEEVSSKEDKHPGIYHMANVYPIGDVNGDHKPDTAFVNYDIKIERDSTFSAECAFRHCAITARFGPNIPSLEIEQSLGLYIIKTFDTNNDGANEIIVFSRWVEGGWKYVSVYSLRKGIWEELAHGKTFGEEDKDFENRVKKLNNKYYLLGDKWEDADLRIRMDTIELVH